MRKKVTKVITFLLALTMLLNYNTFVYAADFAENEVTVIEQDKDGNIVSGSTLEIRDQKGNKIGESWESDGTEHKVMLPDGNYTLCETKTPVGYKKSNDVPFTVSVNEYINELSEVYTSADSTSTYFTDYSSVYDNINAEYNRYLKEGDMSEEAKNSMQATVSSYYQEIIDGLYSDYDRICTAALNGDMKKFINDEVSGALELSKQEAIQKLRELLDAKKAELDALKDTDDFYGKSDSNAKFISDFEIEYLESLKKLEFSLMDGRMKLLHGDLDEDAQEEIETQMEYYKEDLAYMRKNHEEQIGVYRTRISNNPKEKIEYLNNVISKLSDPTKVILEKEKSQTSLQVNKVWADEDNKFKLQPDDITVHLYANGVDTGKTVTLSSSNNWSATFSDLDEYDSSTKINYTVEEAVPNNYTCNNVYSEDGTTVTITNTLKTNTVNIAKVDDKGNALKGAVLEIQDLNGNVLITKWTTDKKVHAVYLPQGEYKLHEVSAPTGYETAEDIKFTVDETGKVYVNGKDVNGTVTMKDTAVVKANTKNTVRTGDNNPIIFYTIALVASIAILGIALMVQCRKKR